MECNESFQVAELVRDFESILGSSENDHQSQEEKRLSQDEVSRYARWACLHFLESEGCLDSKESQWHEVSTTSVQMKQAWQFFTTCFGYAIDNWVRHLNVSL